MNELTITLPCPPQALKPNIRTSWPIKARSVKEYRRVAKEETQVAIYEQWPSPVCADYGCPWDAVDITIRYYHPTDKMLDRDNIKASLKAAFDGITDSGLVVDDADNTFGPTERYIDKANPRVELICKRICSE